MKKIVLITSMLALAGGSLFAQGTINGFGNSSATLVQSNGVSIAANQGKVELYYALSSSSSNALTSLDSFGMPTGTAWRSFSLGSTNGAEGVTTIAPLAGRFSQSAALFTGPEVGPVQVYLQIRAWSGAFANWAAAEAAAFGASPATALGISGFWLNGLGDPNQSPPTLGAMTLGAGGFNGLQVAVVPEPATFALAGLGAAAMLIFRRRK